MARRLIDFLISVSEDPVWHERWANDRAAAIRASGLSKADKDLLMRADSAEIDEAIRKEDPRARVHYDKKQRRRRYVTDSYVTVSYVTVSLADDG